MKYKVIQYFDNYFEKEWIFEDRKKAEEFLGMKYKEALRRYKVTYKLVEIKEKEKK